MENKIDYQMICDETIKLLQAHEWKQSYSKYLSNWARYTKKATNYNEIKSLIRNGFYNANKGLSESLYFEQNFGLYTSVSVESKHYDLRFRGLSIADFHFDRKNRKVFDKPSFNEQKEGSKKTPKLVQLLGEKQAKEWATGEKNIPIEKWSELSRMFVPENIRKDYYNEAVVESALLNHINKHNKKDSPFSNITAITRPKEKTAYFQFNTPLSCSDIHKFYCQKEKPITEFLKYPEGGPSDGGGIDILCRRGRGGSSIVQVVEVKDSYLDNEQPQYAISQAIAYSTFLLRLLRSDEVSCETDGSLSWWKIIVGHRKKDSPLLIEAVVVIPPNPNGETILDFIDKEIYVPWENGDKKDTIRLKYIPFIQGNVREESFSFKYIR